jgi:hypothetical protein
MSTTSVSRPRRRKTTPPAETCVFVMTRPLINYLFRALYFAPVRRSRFQL